MNILLIKPSYYSPYPPLGLLKFATHYKSTGHHVEFAPDGYQRPAKEPDLVLVTSLWTWAWWPVHHVVRQVKMKHKGAKVRLGGIYASLMQDHASTSGADEIITGLDMKVENLAPDYSLVPEWDISVVFTSRGCSRKCRFCAVPTLEGNIKAKLPKFIERQINPDHEWIHVQDNNIVSQPEWKTALQILADHNKRMDFTGGIDLRLISHEQATMIKDMRIRSIKAGFDYLKQHKQVHKGIKVFEDAGQRARDIVLYELFNYKDTPEELFERMKLASEWKAVSYPMRYQPIKGVHALKKDSYIGKSWTPQSLEVVARGRRVFGTHGAFPPTNALRKRFESSTEMHNLLKVDQKKNLKPLENQTDIAEFF